MARVQVLGVKGSFPGRCQEAVRSAGGRLEVVPATSPRSVGQAYERASAVLLMGGADLEPSMYGQVNSFSTGCNGLRDQVELAVLLQALEDGKPVLGICRGHQMIVAATGGSLYQHVTGHQDSVHPVRVSLHSRLRSILAEVLDGSDAWVNSLHHQALQSMPPKFRLAAECGGLVEAIEHESKPVVGVQWHPELLASREADWLCLFEWLVDEAKLWRRNGRQA